MNYFDIIIIGIIFLTSLMAFSMGFVRVFLALLGWVGAIFSTLYLFHYLQPFSRKWISIEIIADGVAGLIIFIGSLIIFTMISHLIGNQVRSSALSALDRTVGLAFGIGLGSIVVSLGYIGLVWITDLPKNQSLQPKWIQDSKTQHLLKWGAIQIQILAPDNWSKVPIIQNKNNRMKNEQFEKLIKPETKKPPVSSLKGYKPSQRREMDRLFKGQQ
tara:strand:+ start:4856 stop:5503 length:648 start_codon:yes stop_codon:yes gene_type:complete